MAALMKPFSPDMKPHEKERWMCVYPAYINSKKTLAEGRKIAKDHCVENPTHQEIRDVISSAGFRVGVENKLYPRERSKELLHRGRIRVQLKNEDGSPFNAEYPTRESLLKYVGDTIPKLKSRQNRPAEQVAQTSTAQSSGKGKGKKGRR